MESPIVTLMLALGLIAVLALSLVRHGSRQDDAVHETTPTVRSLMDDVRSYYGLKPDAARSRAASLLDATPFELVAGVTERGSGTPSQPTGKGR